MAKPGPKPKFTHARKLEFLEALTYGLSVADALLVVDVTYGMFRKAKEDDYDFCRGVKAASVRGKLYHLKRVHDGDERWQSSAWMLERKYGAEYGQKVQLEHGGSVTVRDLERGKARAEEYRRARLAASAHETNGHANGTTH